MKRSEILAAVLLLPIDFILIVCGFFVAYPIGATQLTGNAVSTISFGQYAASIWWIGLVIIPLFALGGLYRLRNTHLWINRIFRIFVGISMGVAGLVLLSLLDTETIVNRTILLYGWLFSTLFVIAGRLCFYLGQRVLHKLGRGVVRVGIVGNPESQSVIARDFRILSLPFHEVVAFIEPTSIERLFNDLSSIKEPLDELIIVTNQYQSQDLSEIRSYCLENQVSFSYVPTLLTDVPGSYIIRKELGVVAIEFRPTPLEGWGRVVKRIFDIVATSFLILIATPIYIVIAIGMFFVDRGPLIYKNQRLGKGMKPIQVWKFRSMRVEYCDGPGYSGAERFAAYLAENPEAKKEWDETSKLRNDPRVSAIGQVLRKTSLDELPQLFNVLQGSLSLVGPRPIVRTANNDEVAKYGDAAKMLFAIKPGVTGLWQVSGRNDVTYAERIQLDMRYIENWTIWWDIGICFRTISVFLPRKGGGAY